MLVNLCLSYKCPIRDWNSPTSGYSPQLSDPTAKGAELKEGIEVRRSWKEIGIRTTL
jgi:hypothetical protein